MRESKLDAKLKSAGVSGYNKPKRTPYLNSNCIQPSTLAKTKNMTIVSDSTISCPACHREWQDHPGAAHCCKLATDLAATLRAVLTYTRPPEYSRDLGEQEVYFDLMENSRRLIVKARSFESEL